MIIHVHIYPSNTTSQKRNVAFCDMIELYIISVETAPTISCIMLSMQRSRKPFWSSSNSMNSWTATSARMPMRIWLIKAMNLSSHWMAKESKMEMGTLSLLALQNPWSAQQTPLARAKPWLTFCSQRTLTSWDCHHHLHLRTPPGPWESNVPKYFQSLWGELRMLSTVLQCWSQKRKHCSPSCSQVLSGVAPLCQALPDTCHEQHPWAAFPASLGTNKREKDDCKKQQNKIYKEAYAARLRNLGDTFLCKPLRNMHHDAPFCSLQKH